MNLTTKQNEIVRFIWSYRRRRGMAPTLAEIAGGLGVSKITVHEHVGLLAKKGALKKEKYQSRSLTLSRPVVREIESVERERGSSGGTLPLLGQIAAGSPIEAIEDAGELDVAATLRLEDASYALRVRGDSMIDDGIHDGDYVLVERRTNPRDGETVVAVLDANEVTLKRFYHEKDGYRLAPANARLKPVHVAKRRLEIRGVVVGQLRRYG